MGLPFETRFSSLATIYYSILKDRLRAALSVLPHCRRAEIGESQSPPSTPTKKAEIDSRRFPPYLLYT